MASCISFNCSSRREDGKVLRNIKCPHDKSVPWSQSCHGDGHCGVSQRRATSRDQPCGRVSCTLPTVLVKETPKASHFNSHFFFALILQHQYTLFVRTPERRTVREPFFLFLQPIILQPGDVTQQLGDVTERLERRQNSTDAESAVRPLSCWTSRVVHDRRVTLRLGSAAGPDSTVVWWGKSGAHHSQFQGSHPFIPASERCRWGGHWTPQIQRPLKKGTCKKKTLSSLYFSGKICAMFPQLYSKISHFNFLISPIQTGWE